MSALIRPDKLIRSHVLKTQVNQVELEAFNTLAGRLGQTGGGFLRQLVCQAIDDERQRQNELKQRALWRAA